MREDVVTITGGKDGVIISLSPTEEWLTITSELARRIDAKNAFFTGSKIIVRLGERPVPKHELSGLKALLERRNLAIDLIISASNTTLDAADALSIRAQPITVEEIRQEDEDVPPTPTHEEGIYGILIRNTVRSGQSIRSQGHVVVYGDVNPGAEIIAVGDIFVWGKLRGNVHAGAYGDEEAVVCALDLQPNQLRIAGYIVTSPPDKRRKIQPEIALIRQNQIYVKLWNG